VLNAVHLLCWILLFSNTTPQHIVTKLPFRYKSGSCSRNHTIIAISTSSLLWNRQTPKCCFSCPHKRQSLLHSHPFLYVLASLARSSFMDVHSAICKPYATLPDMQHSHYTVNLKLGQLPVKFVEETCFTHTNHHELLRGSKSQCCCHSTSNYLLI
jgi:hypothetical protein